MAASKKFGTFGGVFTPSILTILGVIMYLRLPWIVSQGGLYYTIIIIVVAHIVSISTGLSVASIATDKKVEAGGNYYIISRSLGLPIGGTLGLALFVGLSFSISLYIIGFSESLLSTLGTEINKETIRLYGSVTLVALTIIVFISTSLAIKTQYLILAAVLLSLVSVFMGGSDLTTDQFVLNPVEDSENLFVIFGIFFPAVTGFTAGVQMSGDLKDPRKAIPLGTMAAIGVGFLIYMLLAVFVAFNIESDKLISNPNILVEVAWIPQLVVAGIWGATISSAMGSILGAPRILQATSRDRVTPRVFAKGYGAGNEPRRALIFTFLIAEAGILIGDLNAIARIVTIFFLSTYGLINLSYALESWASTDFRPSFKVPVWVGVLGASVCGLLMFELDVVAFIAATIILSLLYLYLKRKELTLESGDTWGSFWASVVRSGLQRLNASVEHKRNWRPNILLFRGKTDSRRHLLDYGKWFAGNTGIISDFELVETHKELLHFTKAAQLVKTDDAEPGIFNRRYECRDIYSGVEQVARFYGFSGVEPNTILLGWPRNTKNPERVVGLLKNLIALDYNVLLLDKSSQADTKFKTIDIWWRGGSNNAALALALMRFMHASREWKEARLRILIIVDDSTLINKVHSNMQRILKELRQDAEVKVINNAIEQRSFHEIMIIESAKSDLTIIGLPDLKTRSDDFVKNTNGFIQDLDSVLLINASSFFEPYFIGIEKKVEQLVRSKLQKVKEDYSKIKLPENEGLAKTLSTIHTRLNDSINEFYSGYIVEIEQDLKKLGDDLRTMTENQLQLFNKKSANLDPVRLARLATRIQNEILFNSWRTIESFRQENLENLRLSYEHGIENILEQQDAVINETPETQTAYYSRENASVTKGDPFLLRFSKARKILLKGLFKKEIKLAVKLKMFVRFHIQGFLRKELQAQLIQLSLIGYGSISQLQKIFNRIQDLLKNLEISIRENGKLEAAKVSVVEDNIHSLFAEYNDIVISEFTRAVNTYASAHHESFQSKIRYFDTLDINRNIKKQFRLKKPAVETENLVSIPAQWEKNMSWMIDFASMELIIILFRNRVTIMLKKWLGDLELDINSKLKTALNKIEKVFTSYINSREEKAIKNLLADSEAFSFSMQVDTKDLAREVQSGINELPEKIEVMSESSFRAVKEKQLAEQEIVSVYLRKMMGYLVNTEFLYDLNGKVNEFNQSVKESLTAINDTQRLIVSALTSSVSAEGATEQLAYGSDMDQVIGRGIQRLAKSKEEIDSALKDTIEFAEERLEASFDKMNPYLITNTTNNLKQYIFSHEQRKVISRLDRVKQQLSGILQKAAVSLQYSQSEGILFARRLNRMTEKETGHIDKMISLTRTFSPNTYIFESLPRYYKQLFIGEGSISRQFLVSREKSVEQAERIIQRYNEGFHGALLVKGEPRSGKTALSRMISSRHFDRNKVFRINPLPGGSVDPDAFIKRIHDVTNTQGDIKKVFETLPGNSAIVLNDLEMWWERSHDGFRVLELIFQLIDSYSEKILFIINANSHFLQLVNKIQNIEKSFVGIVSCELFNAKEIETSILQRHRSTGIKFVLNDKLEGQMSDIRMAGLFNEIFKFSKGFVGVALLSWLTMINKFSDDKITIKRLRKPDLKILADLEREWQIWLTQFILHKQLNKSRLIRIFDADEKYVNQTCEALLRSGFLVKGLNGSLRINPYIEHLFIEKFTQMGLLWSN